MIDIKSDILNKILAASLNSSEHYAMTLFSIVIQTKSKAVLELGVRDGYSSEPLLLGVVYMNGKLVSVDIKPTKWVCYNQFLSNYEFHLCDALKFLEDCV